MRNTFILFICMLVALTSPAFATFGDFQAESQKMTDLIKCPNPKINSSSDLPALYSCILPGAEVVKVFINAEKGNINVKNIKFMWDDWTKDIGDGLHADQAMAEAWLTAIATEYAPEQVAEVLLAFRGSINQTINNDRYALSYSYHSGPAIDERLVTIVDKASIERADSSRKEASGDFERCLAIVSKTSKRDLSSLKGDGIPIEEIGYKSFFIKGTDNSQFFCEVYPAGEFAVKAAFGGNYPFEQIYKGFFE